VPEVADLFAEEGDGNTPLTDEERQQCRISWIARRADLNEVEMANILKAKAWLRGRRRRLSSEDILSDDFVRELHRRMFGDVWRWAGRFRATERNLGVHPSEIAVMLRMLIDDARFWVQHGTYAPDEIALRAKHRLVSIHPFANGNGRCSRLQADLIAQQLGRPAFSWGSGSIEGAMAIDLQEHKRRYIASLRAADNGSIVELLALARS